MKEQAESFHLNGHIIGFRPQTQKLESPYKTPSSTLAVKGLSNHDKEGTANVRKTKNRAKQNKQKKKTKKKINIPFQLICFVFPFQLAWWYPSELFLSTVVLCTCIYMHNQRKDKRQISWRTSGGLNWENKTYELKKVYWVNKQNKMFWNRTLAPIPRIPLYEPLVSHSTEYFFNQTFNFIVISRHSLN